MDFEDLFKGQTIEIECPGCNASFEAPAEKVMKEGSVIIYPHCNAEINIQHTGDSVNDAQKALDDLQKALDDFGKK